MFYKICKLFDLSSALACRVVGLDVAQLYAILKLKHSIAIYESVYGFAVQSYETEVKAILETERYFVILIHN